MAKTGLLIITNPTHIGKIAPTIEKQVKNTLYIQLISALQDPFEKFKIDNCNSAPKYSQAIRKIYAQTVSLCKNLDVRVLLSGFKNSSLQNLNPTKEVEVVIFDKLHEKNDVDVFLKKYFLNLKPECSVITLDNNDVYEENLINTCHSICKHVVIGGTFDRLHAGHKLLLSEAILHAKDKITVGVTDTNMLKDKILWELVQPCDIRIENVKNFIKDICPEIENNVIPIEDPFGPTQSDPTMEMIVVTDETLRGGTKVNELREKNNLKPLQINAIELIDSPDNHEEEEKKISSGTIRMRLLGKLIKEVENKPKIGSPYIIGLTGGIASGKSSISARLAKLGAEVIDCDKVAHELYAIGKPCHKIIRDTFGETVIDEKGEINRRALGAIVFHDKNQMLKLNSLVWPAIASEVKDRISQLNVKGHKIIVIEAAILIQAGWDTMCNEVWTTIIPPAEAILRMKNRNGLSEEDAKARLSLQASNTEHVAKAHVVLCTLWSYDYTQQIVERAWNLLFRRLPAEFEK